MRVSHLSQVQQVNLRISFPHLASPSSLFPFLLPPSLPLSPFFCVCVDPWTMCDAWKRPGLKFNSCKQGLLLTEGVWGNDLLSWYILVLLDLKI